MKMPLSLPKGKAFDVVGLGMNAIDHIIMLPGFPKPNTKSRLNHYEIQGGGQIGNAMTALSRLGARVRCLGKVGSDWQGDMSLEVLSSEGIDTAFMIREKDATNQFAIILVNSANGERTIMAHRHEKLAFAPGDFTKDTITSGSVLLIDGSGGECSLQAARWAGDEGIPVVLDLERKKECVPEMMENAQVIIFGESYRINEYPELNCEEFLEKIAGTYNPVFCGVTLGERGSLGLMNNQFFYSPAYKVDVKDTTGAGDVYHAAFIYGILQDWAVKRIMSFAAAAAALKCRVPGARKGSPSKEEVDRFMEEYEKL